jgi:hypothetical protein
MTFTFIFGALLILGSILTLIYCRPLLAAYLFINPYLIIGIFVCFIAGLIHISFSSVKLENNQEPTEKTGNFRFVRWYIASPFLVIILLKIYGYISLLSSGSDVSHHFDSLEFSLVICGFLVLPEIVRFMKYLFRQ